MVRVRAQAVAINAEGLFFQGRKIVPKLALERGLPTCVYSRETLEPGALMSYGPDQPALFHRAAAYADKLLKGAKTFDLPVEQPAKFEFLESGPIPAIHGIVRWRLKDLAMWVWEEFRVSVSE